MKYVRLPKDLPSVLHPAVLVFSKVSIPGDDRSRTNPGHGYPAHDVPTCQYIAFETDEEQKKWIGENMDQATFVVLEACPKTFKINKQVEFI